MTTSTSSSGTGVDIPDLPLPFADSYPALAIQARAGQTGDGVAVRWPFPFWDSKLRCIKSVAVADVRLGGLSSWRDLIQRRVSAQRSHGATTIICVATRSRPWTFSLVSQVVVLRSSSRSVPVVSRSHSPSGDMVDVTVGGMASASAPRDKYPLNAARHLTAEGVFVVEAGVPSSWLRADQFVNVEHLGSDEVVLDVSRYNAVTQILDENHDSLTKDGLRFEPISCSLIWPGEMDLMARATCHPRRDDDRQPGRTVLRHVGGAPCSCVHD